HQAADRGWRSTQRRSQERPAHSSWRLEGQAAEWSRSATASCCTAIRNQAGHSHQQAQEVNVKRQKGNPSLRSVTRIRDVRHPGISIRITELKHDGPLFAARQVNGKPRYQKLTPEVTWVSLGDTNKARVAKA